jgi:hypothetical protein
MEKSTREHIGFGSIKLDSCLTQLLNEFFINKFQSCVIVDNKE